MTALRAHGGSADAATDGTHGKAPISLTMPMPPSLNGAFRNIATGGRAKTQKTKDWEAHALWRVKAQRLPLVSGPTIIVFGFERSSSRQAADADNRVKLAQDLLVKAGVIEDDRHVVGVAFSWLPPANQLCHCLVMQAQAAAFEFHPSHDGAAGAWLTIAPPCRMEIDDGDEPRIP